MKKGFSIILPHEYHASTEAVFELIKDGTLFRLTGADEITFDFRKGGNFSLQFNKRGTIYGTFGEIIPGKQVVLNWNVRGFGRDEEAGTVVTISIAQQDTMVMLEVYHSGIDNHASAEAKHHAWTEVLSELEKELSALA